jgi:Flp pilus assembly protein TadG
MRPNFGIRTAATLGRLSRDTAGAAAVELAMMVPFLALLTVGVIDFGSYMNASQQVAAATRIGAEYARDSTTCQQSQTGIEIDSVTVVINSDCLSGNSQTGAVGIEATMKNSMNLGAALTFPNMTSCNTSPSSCLTCACDDGSAIGCLNTVCSAGKTPKRVFVTVSASLAITPILPGLPTTVKGLTQLRLNQ